MLATEFDRFHGILWRLSKVYGKEVDNDLAQAYWQALKDLAWETVNRKADEHLKRAKFFPKPSELRPKDTTPVSEMDERSRREFQMEQEKSAKHWDERLATNPIGTKWEILAAYKARTNCGAFDRQPHEKQRRIDFANEATSRLRMEAPEYAL